jgi:pimeloyl-ACP methyl ester carboxylesterase
VIVVPGVLSTAPDFRAFAQELGRHFSVYTIERRGRGRSSPQPGDYSVETDRDDVLALQRLTGASHMFGHSYGGFVALEAAHANPSLQKLAVYEPGISVDGSISLGWRAEYQELLAQDRRLDAFVVFSKAAGPRRAQQTPRWLMKLLMPFVLKRDDLDQKLQLLETNLHEHEQLARRNNTHSRYAEISAVTLLMTGGKSDLSWVDAGIEKLSSVLPHSERKHFAALDHFGPETGAPQVAQTVSQFFLH